MDHDPVAVFSPRPCLMHARLTQHAISKSVRDLFANATADGSAIYGSQWTQTITLATSLYSEESPNVSLLSVFGSGSETTHATGSHRKLPSQQPLLILFAITSLYLWLLEVPVPEILYTPTPTCYVPAMDSSTSNLSPLYNSDSPTPNAVLTHSTPR